MTFVRTDPSSGGINFYKRADEEMQIGDGNLTTVEYGFWQDQLSTILITLTGFSNFDAVRAATEARFGKPYRPEPVPRRILLVWKSNNHVDSL